ncbi:MAG: YqcC family protein [Bryobacteraceae bacterium]
MAKDKYSEAAQRVDKIEEEMRNIRFWSDEPLPPEKYDFQQAFALDTMAFSQWLQFVFSPRVREIVADRGAFPRSSMVAAQAVREFDGLHEAEELISLLSDFDSWISSGCAVVVEPPPEPPTAPASPGQEPELLTREVRQPPPPRADLSTMNRARVLLYNERCTREWLLPLAPLGLDGECSFYLPEPWSQSHPADTGYNYDDPLAVARVGVYVARAELAVAVRVSIHVRPAIQGMLLADWLLDYAPRAGLEIWNCRVYRDIQIELGVAETTGHLSEEGRLRSRLVAVEDGGRLFVLMGTSPETLWEDVAGTLVSAIGSFDVEPKRGRTMMLFPKSPLYQKMRDQLRSIESNVRDLDLGGKAPWLLSEFVPEARRAIASETNYAGPAAGPRAFRELGSDPRCKGLVELLFQFDELL